MNFADLTPHGFCLAWDPALLWLSAGSDALIALAYFSIPAVMLLFLNRRRDLAFRPVFGLFAAFIVTCGATHVMGVVTLWVPAYWVDASLKALTAILSVATAMLLWPLLPRALALPSPAQLRDANTALASQIQERDVVAGRLRESETRLRNLYARSPAVLHAISPEGVLLDVSDRWLDLFGYARNDVIGHHIAEFYASESQTTQPVPDDLRDAPNGVGFAERRLRCRSGEIRDAEAVLALESDTGGKALRVLVCLTDVTARNRAEAALRTSEERLRHAQKMEAVGQLTGGIAHDFNNLLTTVMGSLDLLRRKGNLDDRGQRLVGNAMEGARLATHLTSQLLTFSRKQLLSPAPHAPGQVIEGIHALLLRSLNGRVTLTVAPESHGQWPLMADRNQLEAVLLNLVINARDAIEGDGEITISTANLQLSQAQLEGLSQDTLPAGDYVAIVVADTGRGMTEEVRRRAVEPFFTTKPAGAGTGLGLSQSYGFVTQSGGTLVIDSAPKAGSRVTILLPRAMVQLPVPVSSVPAAPVPARGRGECVLVAEDDALLRDTVTHALDEAGYRVLAAGTGPEALAMLDHNGTIDLLFTDVRMPGGMTGVDLALAARRKLPGLRVVFATGFSERETLDRWPERLDLLSKPYQIDELCARVAAGLRPRASVSATAI